MSTPTVIHTVLLVFVFSFEDSVSSLILVAVSSSMTVCLSVSSVDAVILIPPLPSEVILIFTPVLSAAGT